MLRTWWVWSTPLMSAMDSGRNGDALMMMSVMDSGRNRDTPLMSVMDSGRNGDTPLMSVMDSGRDGDKVVLHSCQLSMLLHTAH